MKHENKIDRLRAMVDAKLAALEERLNEPEEPGDNENDDVKAIVAKHRRRNF